MAEGRLRAPHRAQVSQRPARDFALLLVAGLGAFSGFAPLLSVVPLWAVEGGASESGAGATTGVFMLTTVLAQLVVPWLAGRAGYRVTLGAGILLLGVPAPLYALSPALWALIVVSAVRGLGFGLLTVSGSALVAALVPPSRRGRGTGQYGLAVGVPNLVVLPAGVWVAQHVAYLPVFVVAGALPVLGVVAVAAMSRDGTEPGSGDPGEGGAGPAGAAGDPALPRRAALAALAGPWLIMTGGSLALGGLLTFLPLAVDGVSAVAPTALAVFSGTVLVSRWVAGVIGDRAGAGRLLLPGVLVAAAGMVGPALAAEFDVAGLVAVAAITGSFLYGLGFGALQNATLVVMFARSGPGGYGTASAAWNIAFDAGTGLGAVALGVVVQGYGYAPAFAVAALTVAACLPVAWSERSTGR